jgi:hypothetical protein
MPYCNVQGAILEAGIIIVVIISTEYNHRSPVRVAAAICCRIQKNPQASNGGLGVWSLFSYELLNRRRFLQTIGAQGLDVVTTLEG